MTDKEKYIEFSKIETDIPIFMQWWWMDAVCMEGEWNVVLCERNHKIVGCLIFFLKKEIWFTICYTTSFNSKEWNFHKVSSRSII